MPDERIVYTYDLHLDDKRISVSLATVELEPAGDGHAPDLHGAVRLPGRRRLSGRSASRARGAMLDSLEAELRREPANA